MQSFAEKVKTARAELGLTQPRLGEMIGVSVRSIVAYEKGEKKARLGTMLKLAKALRVSVKFLTDDECQNPLEDIEKDGYIEEARERLGAEGARDVESLLKENAALFAGGRLSQSEKDMFFEAVMTAYVMSKNKEQKKPCKK